MRGKRARFNSITEVNKEYIESLPKEINEKGCWIFLGSASVNRRGKKYGNVNICGRVIRLNRLVAYVYHGLNILDPKELAMHSCDETMCFNPEHINIGDHYQNSMDAIAKGRHYQLNKIYCPKGHLLDGLYENGERYCKTCGQEATRDHRERMKING